MAARMGLPVSHIRGVAIRLTPSRCSEKARVSGLGEKIGNCHQPCVKGRWPAFHFRMAAMSSGSYSSWMTWIPMTPHTSRASSAARAT